MRWRSWMIPLTVVGVFVAIPAGFFISLAVAEKQAIAEFKKSHPFALVEGKSAKEVEAVFGRPNSHVRNEDGSEWLMYSVEKSWMTCVVELKDGRVKQMTFHGK